MDQEVTNKHKEILWDLLANPAENGRSYRDTLEKLVENDPQSGLLQVMLARATETPNITKAAAYFSPKTLHKLWHNPDALLPVSRERINQTNTGTVTSVPENYFNIGQVPDIDPEPIELLSEAPVAEQESLITQEVAAPKDLSPLDGEIAAEHENTPALPQHIEENIDETTFQESVAEPGEQQNDTKPGEEQQPLAETSKQIDEAPQSTENLQVVEMHPETESLSTVELPEAAILQDATEPGADTPLVTAESQHEPETPENIEPAVEPTPLKEEPDTEVVSTKPDDNQFHQAAVDPDDEDPFYDPWDLSKLQDTPKNDVTAYSPGAEPIAEVITDEITGVETAVEPEEALEPVAQVVEPANTGKANDFGIDTYDHSLSAYEEAAVKVSENPPAAATETTDPTDVSSFVQYPAENVFHHQGDIDDEVYDEIVSIDDIGVAALNNKFAESTIPAEDVSSEPVAEEVAAQQSYIDDETEKLIYGNIAETDYLSFDKKLDELRNGTHTPAMEQVASTSAPSGEATVQADSVPVVQLSQTPDPIEQEAVISSLPHGIAEKEPDVISKYNDDNLPYSFMWWLDKTRREHAGVNQPYAEPVKPAAAAESRFRPEYNPSAQTLEKKDMPDELQQQYYANIFSLTSISSISDAEPTPIAFDPENKEDVIIERFIHTDPHIKPLAADKLDNENKAKRSSEDQDVMVTETLARIYGDQMLYHKAIATYKKLMLKFPEKNTYFAARIEQLEKKIN